MVDIKQIEKEGYEFLKKMFPKVEWLSQYSFSSIDYKCYNGEISYLIECKYAQSGKVKLSPSQKNVDAVIIHNGKEIKLIWRKDFKDFVIISKTAVMKIDEDIKKQLDNLKIHKREPYTNVIERILLNRSS